MRKVQGCKNVTGNGLNYKFFSETKVKWSFRHLNLILLNLTRLSIKQII